MFALLSAILFSDAARATTCDAATLSAPAGGAVETATVPTFSWAAVNCTGGSYRVDMVGNTPSDIWSSPWIASSGTQTWTPNTGSPTVWENHVNASGDSNQGMQWHVEGKPCAPGSTCGSHSNSSTRLIKMDYDNDTYLVNVPWPTDCDDGDNTIYPGATETCADGINQDCDHGGLRGVSIGTNNGDQFWSAYDILNSASAMNDFFTWTDSVHANIVGIYVAMQYEDAVDTSFTMTTHDDIWGAQPVDPEEEGPGTWTWDADVLEQLTSLIKAHHVDNDSGKPVLGVYWALTPEPLNDGGTADVSELTESDDYEGLYDRNLFGYTWAEAEDCCYSQLHTSYTHDSSWIWDSPDGAGVEAFWDSYTASAVALATEAELQGVDVFGLGVETNGIFRTKWVDSDGSHNGTPGHVGHGYLYTSGGALAGSGGSASTGLFNQVDAVFTGPITFELYVDNPNPYYPDDYDALMDIWGDVPFSIVGLSAWLPLDDTSTAYSDEWDYNFNGTGGGLTVAYGEGGLLAALHAEYPTKPISLMQFGYTDVEGSHGDPTLDDGASRADDTDFTGGDEQAAVLDGFYTERASGTNCQVIEGTFLWGNITDQNSGGTLAEGWNTWAQSYYTFSTRTWTDTTPASHSASTSVITSAYSDAEWQ